MNSPRASRWRPCGERRSTIRNRDRARVARRELNADGLRRTRRAKEVLPGRRVATVHADPHRVRAVVRQNERLYGEIATAIAVVGGTRRTPRGTHRQPGQARENGHLK